jgi:hypothetical protein
VRSCAKPAQNRSRQTAAHCAVGAIAAELVENSEFSRLTSPLRASLQTMAEETISNQLRLFRFVSYGVDLISLNIRNESKPI